MTIHVVIKSSNNNCIPARSTFYFNFYRLRQKLFAIWWATLVSTCSFVNFHPAQCRPTFSCHFWYLFVIVNNLESFWYFLILFCTLVNFGSCLMKMHDGSNALQNYIHSHYGAYPCLKTSLLLLKLIKEGLTNIIPVTARYFNDIMSMLKWDFVKIATISKNPEGF